MATKNSINSNIPIEVALGGTGAVTLTQDGVVLGNTTSAVNVTAAGTDGQLLIGATGGACAFATVTAGTNITLTPGANSLTIDANTGAQVVNYVSTTTSPYVVAADDYFVSIDSTLATKVVHLPNSTTVGRICVILDHAGTAGTNQIDVTTPGGVVQINGVTTYSINTDDQAISVLWNGTSYQIF